MITLSGCTYKMLMIDNGYTDDKNDRFTEHIWSWQCFPFMSCFNVTEFSTFGLAYPIELDPIFDCTSNTILIKMIDYTWLNGL